MDLVKAIGLIGTSKRVGLMMGLILVGSLFALSGNQAAVDSVIHGMGMITAGAVLAEVLGPASLAVDL